MSAPPPIGEIRRALQQRALERAAEIFTAADLAVSSLVSPRSAASRRAVQRMAAAGQLERVGLVRTGGRGRPAVAYRLVQVCALRADPCADLAAAWGAPRH